MIRSQALGGSIGGKVSITHEGIVEVEEAITNPQVIDSMGLMGQYLTEFRSMANSTTKVEKWLTFE